ncbi:HAD-IIB family hydrolase [Pediococcus acidilactici]|jgi:Cof subfamily protein (haloacid dehalogenase superfamily)|uniref:HAD-IIB family hydrolase n=1 Tax=Pediococcus acidilactici TaxID=1254 RepID=UPI002F267813|nr:HAD-IIB family hydrolase [Pediococcus acidilactici]
MIATDMDQTFLNNQNTYNKDRFKELFNEMQRQKIHFVAASGSQHERLRALFTPYANQMDFISQNGSIIYSGDQLLDVEQLPVPLVQQTIDTIFENFSADEVMINVCGLTSSYIDQTTPQEIVDFLHKFYKEIRLVKNLRDFTQNGITDPIVKIAVSFADSADLPSKIQNLRQKLDPQLTSLSSGFNTELIGFSHVDKASALKHLMANYRVAPAELVTFGDNENDLKMLQMTPNGYAMKSGYPIVKEVTQHQTRFDNDHDGVLDAIESLL